MHINTLLIFINAFVRISIISCSKMKFCRTSHNYIKFQVSLLMDKNQLGLIQAETVTQQLWLCDGACYTLVLECEVISKMFLFS